MALPATTVVDAPSPFIGLRPFDESDAHRFYGRDHQVDELLRRLAQARFQAVIGTSGCGKSSLVRAGLIPSLKRGFLSDVGTRWKVVVMRPGSDPFGALARELDKPSVLGPQDNRLGTLQRSSLGCVECVRPDLGEKESLLLVVDQFEEIFRYRKEAQGAGADDQADAFVRLLLASAEQDEVAIFVVLTMRSDYLGDCAVFRGLSEALNDAQYLVPVLTRPQLREVLEAPVASAGAEIAPELVQRVLNDVGHGLEQELDQLPVLQHALLRTWQESAGASAIQLEHYGRAGRMSGALNQHAKQLYSELSEPQQAIAKRVFQRLTEKETAGRDIRRPTSFGELREVTGASSEELTHIIEHFQDFLYSSDNPPLNDRSMIDITHEALIRQWGDLKGWAGEEAHSAEVYGRLARDAGRKARKWEDPDLAEVLRLREAARWNDTWAQRYTPGAFSYPQAEEFLEDSRRHRFWRKVQRLGLIGLLLAIPAALYYFQVETARRDAEIARRDAEIERVRTQADAKTAEADRLTAQAQTAGDERDQLLAEAARLRAEGANLAESAKDYETLTQQREAELAELREERDDLSGRLEDTEKNVASLTSRLSRAQEAEARLSAEKTALEEKLAAATVKLDSLAVQLESFEADRPPQFRLRLVEIEALEDGSGGVTGWTFQVYGDGRSLFFLPKFDYDDSKPPRRYFPEEQVAMLELEDTIDIRIEGQRIFGNDTAHGDARITEADHIWTMLVRAPDPKDGAFGFQFELLTNVQTLEPHLKPGTVKVNPKDGLEYAWIPHGEFEMGCVKGDDDCDDDEKPQHSVTISKGFWLGRHEVPVKAYRQFLDETTPGAEKRGGPGDVSVTRVSWNEARRYCEWAGGRLPTEAEWEYAALGGRPGLKYLWGDKISYSQGNWGPDGLDANEWNLHGMAGTVWEWTQDWYGGEYYKSSPSDDPQGPETGQYRVSRGGSRGDYEPKFLRCSNRGWFDPYSRNLDMGLRCVREVIP